MALDPAAAAQQQADDAQRAVDQARARIAELERSIYEQQDALAKEKTIYNDQVRTAQMAQANATRLKNVERVIITAGPGNNPNPVI